MNTLSKEEKVNTSGECVKDKILKNVINSIRMAPETEEGNGLYAVKASDLNYLIETATAIYKQKDLTEVQNVLIELEEAYDGRADAEILYDGPSPNFEMRCLMRVRECLEILGVQKPKDDETREFLEYVRKGGPF